MGLVGAQWAVAGASSSKCAASGRPGDGPHVAGGTAGVSCRACGCSLRGGRCLGSCRGGCRAPCLLVSPACSCLHTSHPPPCVPQEVPALLEAAVQAVRGAATPEDVCELAGVCMPSLAHPFRLGEPLPLLPLMCGRLRSLGGRGGLHRGWAGGFGWRGPHTAVGCAYASLQSFTHSHGAL